MKKKIIALILCLALLLSAFPLAASASATEPAAEDINLVPNLEMIYDASNYERDFETGQVIVKVDSNRMVTFSDNMFDGVDVVDVEDLSVFNTPEMAAYSTQGGGDVLLLTLAVDSKQGVLEAIDTLKNNVNVVYAEPNYIFEPTLEPNDAYFTSGSMGGLTRIDMVGAWNYSTGSPSVRVGILDSGLEYTHPDLARNVDSSLAYNAYANSTDVTDYHSRGHGTHVAGTVGAVGNNGIGVVGVCWNVTMIPIKIGNDTSTASSNSSACYRALQYAESLGLDAVNISYSFFEGGHWTQTVEDGINTYQGLVVGAAGNGNLNLDNYTSYDCENLILVGNSTLTDTKSSSSSYGGRTVDLFAPGTVITSTTTGNGYVSLSGTSMAAPHVTGAAALLLSYKSTLTISQLKEALLNSVDRVSAFSEISITGGRLNALNALRYVYTHFSQIRTITYADELKQGGTYRIATADGYFFTVGNDNRLYLERDNGTENQLFELIFSVEPLPGYEFFSNMLFTMQPISHPRSYVTYADSPYIIDFNDIQGTLAYNNTLWNIYSLNNINGAAIIDSFGATEPYLGQFRFFFYASPPNLRVSAGNISDFYFQKIT